MFITLEGIEGCGKTTIINKLKIYLNQNGKDVIVTREPGGSYLGNDLRAILLNPNNNINPAAELYLFLADRAQHINDIILPAIHDNKIVLCDRYMDSTIAYQGYGRGIEADVITAISQLANLVPDITFLLDLPVHIGLSRIKKRIDSPLEDKFDSERTEFHELVREGFLYLAKQNPKRIKVIDASKNIEDVFKACIQELPL